MIYKSKNKTKDGRSYFFRVRYKDIFGASKDYSSQKFLTLKEAKNEEAKFLIKIGEQKYSSKNVTVGEIYNEWFSRYSKTVKIQSAIQNNNLYVHLHSLSKYKISDLNSSIYNKFYLELEKKDICVSRKNKIIGLFKRLILYSNEYYNTPTTILKYIDKIKNTNYKNKEMNFFDLKEFNSFYSVINDIEYECLFLILYLCGLRLGEALCLSWKDIDFNKKTLSVSKTLISKIKGVKYLISTPKTKNSIRVLPMPERLVKRLKEWYSEQIKYSDFSDDWFVLGGPIPLKENTIQERKNKYCKLSNNKIIRIHDFRHSCASLLLNSKASITLVSKYLGHSKVSVTLDIYSHFYKSELDDLISTINKLV